MPYGFSNDQWKSMGQEERTKAANAGGLSSNNANTINQANQMLRVQGKPGQYSSSGYQVLGGKGTGAGTSAVSGALSALGLGGGGVPSTASGMVSTGVPSAGGVGLPVGGGAGTTGAGSGGAAPPANYSAQAQQNPYIKQLMELSTQQFATPLDREAELSKLRREQSQRMNEARQAGAAGGRGGLWGAQQQQLANTQQQEVAGTIKGFGDRETEARRALLATMTGIGGTGVQDIDAQLRQQLAAQQLNEQARQANLDYNAKMALVPYQAQAMQLQAASDLMKLI